MIHFFEQISNAIKEAEWIDIVLAVLIAVLIVSFIVVNVVTCICQISMRKSLKKIAGRCEKAGDRLGGEGKSVETGDKLAENQWKNKSYEN